MAKHDRLIAFLEHEASFLRDRIAGLKQQRMPGGVTNGEGEESPTEAMLRETKAKLAEIEDHIRDLRFGS